MKSELASKWELLGGKAPDHWGYATVEQLLETNRSIAVGVMYPGNHTEEGVPLVKVSDVKGGRISARPEFLISAEKDKEHQRTKLVGNELLITLVGNPGDCVIVTDEMIGWNVARALAVLRFNDPSLRAWIRSVMLSAPCQHFFDSRLNTTVQKTLNLKDIRELVIPLPPKNEREMIGGIISAFDDKIELNRQINTTLESMAQALFKSWFVDFDPVIDNALAAGNTIPDALQARAERRKALHHQTDRTDQGAPLQPLPADIRALFPDSFVFNEEMGWVPEGWRVSTVGDELETVGGGTPSTKNSEFWEGGKHPFCTPKDMSSLGAWVLLDTERHLTDQGVAKISSGQLPAGVVLMSSRAPIGYLAISDVPVSINQGIIALVPNKTYSSMYLLNWTMTNMDKVMDRANGSTFLEISKKNFRPIPFLVPEPEALKSFDKIASSLQARMHVLAKQSADLVGVRGALLPKLLSGDIQAPVGAKYVREAV